MPKISESNKNEQKVSFFTSHKMDKIKKKRYSQLKKELAITVSELHSAIDNFNNVADPKLIDFYIYKIHSVQIMYEHIIEEIKTL